MLSFSASPQESLNFFFFFVNVRLIFKTLNQADEITVVCRKSAAAVEDPFLKTSLAEVLKPVANSDQVR